MSKTQLSFRFDDKVVYLLQQFSKLYPRLSMTDVVDMIVKHFFDKHYPYQEDDLNEVDEIVGRYMRGDMDEGVLNIYKHLKNPS